MLIDAQEEAKVGGKIGIGSKVKEGKRLCRYDKSTAMPDYASYASDANDFKFIFGAKEATAVQCMERYKVSKKRVAETKGQKRKKLRPLRPAWGSHHPTIICSKLYPTSVS